MTLFLIFTGCLLTGLVAVNERKSLLSIVSVANGLFFLGFVARPLFILLHFDGASYSGIDVKKEPDALNFSLFIANYFYSFFVVGVILPSKKFWYRPLNVSDRSAVHLSLILMTLGLIGYGLFLNSTGVFDGGAFAVYQRLFGSRGFYSYRLLAFLFIFGVFGYLTFKKVNHVTRLLLISIAILISLSFYARQHFVIFSLLAFHLYIANNQGTNNFKNLITKIITAGMLVIFLSYSMAFLVKARSVLSGNDKISISESTNVEIIDYVLNSGQITYLDFSIAAIHYQKDNKEMAGHSLVNLGLSFVPSNLYPGKLESFPRALAKKIPLDIPKSPAFGFSTELFFNFPYVYVVVGPIIMFTIGAFFRKLFLSMRENYFYFMLYVMTYSSFFMFVRAGFFSSAMAFFEKIIPFLLILGFYKLMPKKRLKPL